MEGKLIFYIIFATIFIVQIALFFARDKIKEWLFTLLYCIGTVCIALIAFFTGDMILKIIGCLIIAAAIVFIIINLIDRFKKKA